MAPQLILVIAIASVVAVAGYRDLRVIFLVQVTALVANLLLPIAPFGVAITSQRVVALVAAGVCGLLFVKGRIGISRPTVGQLAFAGTFAVIVVVHALHMLASPNVLPSSGIVSAILNVVLFFLTSVIVQNIPPDERRILFNRWLPLAVSLVLFCVVGYWLFDMLSRPDLDLSRFHHGYRLRNTADRPIVNVWAASLVLAVPFVWQPLFVKERLDRKLICLLALGITTLAVVLTFSRAALFALIVLLAAGLGLASVGHVKRWSGMWRSGSGGRRLLAALSCAAVLASAVVVAMERVGLPVVGWLVERVQPVIAGTDPSLERRLGYYQAAWDLLQGLPILGYGPAAAEVQRLPENTLIFVTLYYGPIPLIFLVGMLSIIGWQVMTWWWQMRAHPLAAAWPASYFAYVFLLLTNDFLFFSMGTILVATITSLTLARHWPDGIPSAGGSSHVGAA